MGRYLASEEYARFVRKGGGVTGRTRSFFFFVSGGTIVVVLAAAFVVIGAWFLPSNRPGYTGSGARSTVERVALWLFFAWLPTFFHIVLAYF